MKFLILFVLGLLAFTLAEKSYKNYKVVSVVASNEDDVKLLRKISEGIKYDFWKDAINVGDESRIMVAPEDVEEFETMLKNGSLTSKIEIPDVSSLIAAQKFPANGMTKTVTGNFNFIEYHTLERFYAWYDELVTLYPNVVTVSDIGTTYEGRAIKAIKIDFAPSTRATKPLTAFLECGVHAREWISPATCAGMINEFLISTDPAVRKLAETFVWHIIPIVNPDGYAYTFSTQRLWRKNRNPTNSETCPGVDLNRNFDFLWNTIGASDEPCTQIYAGPHAASELETRALSNYVLQTVATSEVIYYWAFHSFSQMVLIPYSHASGNDKLQVGNYGDLFEIGIKGADKLTARHGTPYTVGTSDDILYAVSGSTFDWAKGAAGIPIASLTELRDLGLYGFLLPPDQIIPNNEEILDLLVEMDRVARELRYYHADSGSIVPLYSALVLVSSLFSVLYFN